MYKVLQDIVLGNESFKAGDIIGDEFVSKRILDLGLVEKVEDSDDCQELLTEISSDIDVDIE